MANSQLIRTTSNIFSILNKKTILLGCENLNAIKCNYLNFIPYRCSSFRSSHPVKDESEYPSVEIIKNPPEWKYVERLLPNTIVPMPDIKNEYPSGWKPQDTNIQTDYFIARTKNHMIPVYLTIKFRGTRRITLIKKIEGDIWSLEKELKETIEKRIGKKIASRINEMNGQIQFKGDFVNIAQEFFLKKGL